MVRSPVQVYIRTRPTAQSYAGFKCLPDGTTVSIKLGRDAAAGKDKGAVNNSQDSYTFKYDACLDNATQETVFVQCAHEVVHGALAGYNGTIFCYGQTGAGKTYTMSGDANNYSQRGIIARALHSIFSEIDMRVDRMYSLTVSYLEVYNDTLYDLLSPTSSEQLHVYEEANNTSVRGLTRMPVSSEQEALAAFFSGEAARSVGKHVLSALSSRSHCIFTINIEMRASADAKERAVLSKVNLVDLAGSERTKKTNVSGNMLKEANFINQSLTFLEQTVHALSRKAAHVPFRQSKLTSVLKDALGGNSKTVMIANVWPEAQHMEETLSTLRFASRVRELVTEVQINESKDPALLLKKYERQIRELKEELAMRDVLSGRGRVEYNDLTEGELLELQANLRAFLTGSIEVDQLALDKMKVVKESLKMCRNLYQALATDLQAQLIKQQQAVQGQGVPQTAEPADVPGQVGTTDAAAANGFTVGRAPSLARPEATGSEATATPRTLSPDSRAAAREELASNAARTARSVASPESTSRPDTMAADRNTEFVRFKRADPEAQKLNAQLKAQQAEIRDRKAQLREQAGAVNGLKVQIDELAGTIQELVARRPADLASDVIDDEEFSMRAQLKQLKVDYRRVFQQLKDDRAQLDHLVLSAAEARSQLIATFETWMAAGGGEGGEDLLDAGEEFARLEIQRIVNIDPDSVAFYAARKTARSQNKSPGRAGIRG